MYSLVLGCQLVVVHIFSLNWVCLCVRNHRLCFYAWFSRKSIMGNLLVSEWPTHSWDLCRTRGNIPFLGWRRYYTYAFTPSQNYLKVDYKQSACWMTIHKNYCSTGDDNKNPSRYHPFYITDSAEGGYGQKSESEQNSQKIYAGVSFDSSGYPYPTAGIFFHWNRIIQILYYIQYFITTRLYHETYCDM